MIFWPRAPPSSTPWAWPRRPNENPVWYVFFCVKTYKVRLKNLCNCNLMIFSPGPQGAGQEKTAVAPPFMWVTHTPNLVWFCPIVKESIVWQTDRFDHPPTPPPPTPPGMTQVTEWKSCLICFISFICEKIYKVWFKNLWKWLYVIECEWYLTFWPVPRDRAKKQCAVACPIHLSNSHTKFVWILSNGFEGDSVTEKQMDLTPSSPKSHP